MSSLWGWSQTVTKNAVVDYSVQLTTGNGTGVTYQWSVDGGTSTNLSAITGNSATITWDGAAGTYTLTVQATDGNGCLTEPITKTITIEEPGNAVFASATGNTTVCSDLSGGEGSSPAHTQSIFNVTYDGTANLESATVTIQNPDGNYVDLNGTVLADQSSPNVVVNNDNTDKEIQVSVTDAWENTGSSDVAFTVTLVSVKTTDGAVVNAAATGATRTITVSPKPVISFN